MLKPLHWDPIVPCTPEVCELQGFSSPIAPEIYKLYCSSCPNIRCHVLPVLFLAVGKNGPCFMLQEKKPKKSASPNTVTFPLPTLWFNSWEEISLPSRGISLFIKPNFFSRNTNEWGFEEELQELAAINWLHSITQSNMSGAKGMMHVLQPISHSIYCIDDKSHFTVLYIILF